MDGGLHSHSEKDGAVALEWRRRQIGYVVWIDLSIDLAL